MGTVAAGVCTREGAHESTRHGDDRVVIITSVGPPPEAGGIGLRAARKETQCRTNA